MVKGGSRRWLQEHFSDPYVKRAKEEGFRARSVYKLIEIAERYKFIKLGMSVVDLGSAPGGWSLYLAKLVGKEGKVFAVDRLAMKPIMGVDFIQGDFTQKEVVELLSKSLHGKKIDVVLSDMAPNLSGIKIVDQTQAVELAEKAFNFAKQVLKSNGSFLLKVFQGIEFADFVKILQKSFKEVRVIKPDASRARSSELFLLARGLVEEKV